MGSIKSLVTSRPASEVKTGDFVEFPEDPDCWKRVTQVVDWQTPGADDVLLLVCSIEVVYAIKRTTHIRVKTRGD